MLSRRDFIKAIILGGAVTVIAGSGLASQLSPPEPVNPPVTPPSRKKALYGFYYPWYGSPKGPTKAWKHWNQNNHNPDNIVNGRRDIASKYYPEIDPIDYDSLDVSLIDRHLDMSKEAGLSGWIVSWWSPKDQTDVALGKILERSNGKMKISIYYEHAWGEELSEDKVVSDLSYVLQNYSSDSNWMRKEGKPVIYIYGAALAALPLESWKRIISRLESSGLRAYYNADVNASKGGINTLEEALTAIKIPHIDVFDGFHIYMPAFPPTSLELLYSFLNKSVKRKNKSFMPAIYPGFDNSAVSSNPTIIPRTLEIGGEQVDTLQLTMNAAKSIDPEECAVETINELHESTIIERTLEFGDKAIKQTYKFAQGE